MKKIKQKTIIIFVFIVFCAVIDYSIFFYKKHNKTLVENKKVEQISEILEIMQIAKNNKTSVSFDLNQKEQISSSGKHFYRTFYKNVRIFTNFDFYRGEYDKDDNFDGNGLFIHSPEGSNKGKIENGKWKNGILVEEKKIFLSEKTLSFNKTIGDIVSWRIYLGTMQRTTPDLKWNSHELTLEFQNKSPSVITRVDLYIEVKNAKNGFILQKKILEDAFSGKEIKAMETKKFITKYFYLFWHDDGILLTVQPYKIYTNNSSL